MCTILHASSADFCKVNLVSAIRVNVRGSITEIGYEAFYRRALNKIGREMVWARVPSTALTARTVLVGRESVDSAYRIINKIMTKTGLSKHVSYDITSTSTLYQIMDWLYA